MIYLWATLLAAVNLGFLGLSALTLPGNWLMIASTAAMAWWLRDQHMISPWVLVAMTALAGLGELAELLASSVLVRRSGGTRRSGLAALIGGLLGAIIGGLMIPLPLFGSVIGACLGAALGATLLERHAGRSFRQAGRTGWAAGWGWLLGGVAKFAVGTVIWTLATVSAFWP